MAYGKYMQQTSDKATMGISKQSDGTEVQGLGPKGPLCMFLKGRMVTVLSIASFLPFQAKVLPELVKKLTMQLLLLCLPYCPGSVVLLVPLLCSQALVTQKSGQQLVVLLEPSGSPVQFCPIRSQSVEK
eukprot:Gb_24659 [translate_table: standard]